MVYIKQKKCNSLADILKSKKWILLSNLYLCEKYNKYYYNGNARNRYQSVWGFTTSKQVNDRSAKIAKALYYINWYPERDTKKKG
jgi:hypothetical protein